MNHEGNYQALIKAVHIKTININITIYRRHEKVSTLDMPFRTLPPKITNIEHLKNILYSQTIQQKIRRRAQRSKYSGHPDNAKADTRFRM